MSVISGDLVTLRKEQRIVQGKEHTLDFSVFVSNSLVLCLGSAMSCKEHDFGIQQDWVLWSVLPLPGTCQAQLRVFALDGGSIWNAPPLWFLQPCLLCRFLLKYSLFMEVSPYNISKIGLSHNFSLPCNFPWPP